MGKLGWLTISCVALIFCGVGAITSYAQTLTALISFNMVDGAYPSAALVQGRDGNLYGTTSGGGIISCLPPQGCGTVFKLTPAGILTTLHKFCPQKNCTDGQAPSALVLGTDGNFYGIAGGGGAHAGGTIFKITPRGTLTTLYSFCAQANCSDGFVPRSLTLGTDGNFYGATNFGGAGVYCCGTVFKITPDGQLTTLHNFDGSDGSSPSSLIQGSDGNFYGTTAAPLARRHGDDLAPVHLSGWTLAVWSLVLARRPVLALAALAASVTVLARRLRGLVRDPVGVATHIAGGGTVRAALPALGSLTRAWSPALVLGLAFRRTRAVSALALLIPAVRDWASDQQGLAARWAPRDHQLLHAGGSGGDDSPLFWIRAGQGDLGQV